MSSFTHHHVDPNQYDFIYAVKNKNRNLADCLKCSFPKNGYINPYIHHKMVPTTYMPCLLMAFVRHRLKFQSFKKSYRNRTTWGCMIDWIFIFLWRVNKFLMKHVLCVWRFFSCASGTMICSWGDAELIRWKSSRWRCRLEKRKLVNRSGMTSVNDFQINSIRERLLFMLNK